MNKKNLLLLVSALIVLLAGMSCNLAAPTELPAEATTSLDVSRAIGATPTYAQEVISGPLRDSRWVYSTATNLDVTLLGKKIVAYQIKWFSGSWSSWFIPGVNDLYKKPGENTRRTWACFNDHTFKYIAVPVAYANSIRSFSEFNKGIIGTGIQASGANFYTFGPSRDSRWVYSLNINIDKTIDKKKIVAYKVKWFNGTKSGWFIPGYSDIYQKPGENVRRWWACFNDHSHEYIAFPVC